MPAANHPLSSMAAMIQMNVMIPVSIARNHSLLSRLVNFLTTDVAILLNFFNHLFCQPAGWGHNDWLTRLLSQV